MASLLVSWIIFMPVGAIKHPECIGQSLMKRIIRVSTGPVTGKILRED
jgi:hypothetical protein